MTQTKTQHSRKSGTTTASITSKLGEVTNQPVTKPEVLIDYSRYEAYLDSVDLSDDQKQEFLGTLWNIIAAFVDLGFGVHPLQQAARADSDTSGLLAERITSATTTERTTSDEKCENK